jgi:hypothetical protein
LTLSANYWALASEEPTIRPELLEGERVSGALSPSDTLPSLHERKEYLTPFDLPALRRYGGQVSRGKKGQKGHMMG